MTPHEYAFVTPRSTNLGDAKETSTMTTTPTNIRTLFLHPKPTYAIGEAATLLEMEWGDLRGWMKSGEMEGIETDEGLVLPWAELVSFGMDFWSQEVVEVALGEELAEALPELLRLTELEVHISRMEVVALERLAALDGETVRPSSHGSCAISCPCIRSGCRRRCPDSRRRWPGRRLHSAPRRAAAERRVRQTRSRRRRETRRVAGRLGGPMTQDGKRRQRCSASPRDASRRRTSMR
jgi:hypothetical protein